MTRSTRSRRRGGEELSGGLSADRPRQSRACDLNETIDENDEDLMRAIQESLKDCSAATIKKQPAPIGNLENTTGKGKRKAAPTTDKEAEADKENNGSAQQQRGKRKKKTARSTPLSERRDLMTDEPSSPSSTVHSTQESPPIFAFKHGQTALKQRKMQKLKRREQEGSQKRIEELKAYFGSVDNEQLSFA